MADEKPETMESLTAKLIEAEGRATDAEAKAKQSESTVNEYKGKCEELEATCSDLTRQIGEAKSGKALATALADVKNLKGQLEVANRKAAAKSAKAGTYVVVGAVKEHGKTMQAGEAYEGKNHKALLEVGAIAIITE